MTLARAPTTPKTPTAGPDRVLPADPAGPTVSVVVTCYNYGHFLDACLDSLYAQSRPPDEIVVVNDGSTDGSSAVLAGHAGRVKVVETANLGQAAAFNRGFAETAGDIVVFLDADDLLAPVAVETILLHWADDLAVLSFGLQTVDGAGRGTGVHRASLEADSGDNRPRLLATGTFRFPPTSGNAFSRRCLSAILPMPEPRWRISADCYLIRAAALHGRFGHVARVLGHYRIHGGNNYAIGGAMFLDLDRRAENLGDMANALRALAETSDRFAGTPAEARALADALRRRARAVEDELAGLAPPPAPAPDTSEAARALAVPRWPVHVPFNRRIGPGRAETLPALEDLILPDIAGAGGIAAGRVTLDFSVDPHPDVLILHLHFTGSGQGTDPDLTVVSVDGRPTWEGRITTDAPVRVPIRPDLRSIRRRLRVEMIPVPGHGTPPGLIGLEVSTQGPEFPEPLLEPGAWHPVGHALAAALDPREWHIDPAGSATLTEGAGRLRFSTSAGIANDLMIAFDGVPPRGTLILSERGQVLFNGATGTSRWILLRLPATPSRLAHHDLYLSFDSHAAEAHAGPLRIMAIGVLRHGGGDRPPGPPLSPGETVTFGAGRAGSACLAASWDQSDPAGARNLTAEAVILCRISVPARGLRLVLDVAPVLPHAPDLVHLVGVSLDGAFLAAAALEGSGMIEVPLPDARHGRDLSLVLHSTLLPRLAPVGDDASGSPTAAGSERSDAGPPEPPEVLAAMLTLRGLTLHGHPAAEAGSLPMPRASPPPSPAARRLLDRAALALADDTPASDAEAAALRAEVNDFLATCSANACSLFAATPQALETLARLGARTRHAVRCPSEAAVLPRLLPSGGPDASPATESPTAPPGEALRAALLGILHAPSCDLPEMADLPHLPPPLLWSIPALAAWLAAPPEIETADAHARYVVFLERLLGSVDHLLACEPEGSALFRLAAEIVRRLRATRVIFGRGVLRDLIRLRGRCVERLLSRQGAILPAARMKRPPRSRLRVGVLARDVTPTPEGWALLGMYGGLDRARFDPVLIRLDASDTSLDADRIFADELCLRGLGLDDSVAAIRALDLDLFLTGAYAGEWEKAGWILAHRLARVQVWPGAVCPSTSGFRSFDRVLSCRATEPEAPERHYLHPLAWIDGPLQAAYAFPPPAVASSADLRRTLGLARGRRMLVSGAMAHKIDDALLAAWAAILASAPQADLVLYPFAPNWSIPFSERRFRDRIDSALARAGVEADRVRVLATQSPEGVQAIVRAADLYLDSFPYTGATTVCEALSCATPVLTLAGDSLRELTGASWVRAFGLPDLVAGSPDDYVDRAVALATEPAALRALRRRLQRRVRRVPSPHCDIDAFGRAFSDALWRIAQDSGILPVLASEAGLDMAEIDRAIGAKPKAPAIVLRVTPPAERFAVLSSPRSGSSLLCHMLNATSGICCHYELFQEDMIELYGQTLRDHAILARRNADPVGFLRRTLDESLAAGYQAVGFKHFSFFERSVLAAVAADASIRLIVLRRTNTVAKFASLEIAKATQHWKAAAGTPVERPTITFEPEAFLEHERWDNGLYRDLEDALARHRREALFVEFSDLRSAATGRRLGEFLGRTLQWENRIAMERLNPGRIVDRFSNPDAVRDFLQRRGVPEWAEHG